MSHRSKSSLKISILGSRGYPSSYGGFETLVRVLAPYLAETGHTVTVFSRPNLQSTEDSDPRISVSTTRGIDSSSLSTLTHGLHATIRAWRERPDVVLVLNVANGLYVRALNQRSIPTLVNVDGLEWTREKWGSLAKRAFLAGARATASSATDIVVDSRRIGDYWMTEFNRSSHFIPYGGDTFDLENTSVQDLENFQPELPAYSYCLVICRLVPENSLAAIFSILRASRAPAVIVGDFPTQRDPGRAELESLLRDRPDITWLGHVSDQRLLWTLRRFAGAYLHGHKVGGTNPGLLEAIHAGVPVLAMQSPFNREVLGSTGPYFTLDGLDEAARLVEALCADDTYRAKIADLQRRRLAPTYLWEHVCSSYEALLRHVAARAKA